jgi:ribosomal protein L11 methyltransferase
MAPHSLSSLSPAFDRQTSSFAEVTIQSVEAVGEGIANLLLDLGADGLIEEDEGPSLTLRCYFPWDNNLPLKLSVIRSYFQSLRAMGLEVGQALVEARLWEDPGWRTKWKEHFRLIRVGRHLVVKPSWQSYPAGFDHRDRSWNGLRD